MSAVSTPKSGRSDDKGQQLVKVCVRVRPLNSTECAVGSKDALKVTSTNTLRTNTAAEGGRKVESQIHKYDRIHPPNSTQEDVFENSGIADLCNNAAAGYTATVFAYGQTGSGKTHTLIGPPDGMLSGIIPRSSRYIFEEMIPHLRVSQRVVVRASFIEIYNEQTYDLLSPSENSLPVRWNAASNSFFVESAMVVTCDTLDDLIAVLQEGVSNRATASHLLNKDSSRSHSILTVYFETTASHHSGQVAQGKINFVDLAGSERLKDSGSTGGTAVENCHINKSLLALGQVISVLSEKGSLTHNHGTYVPYRDSKLTKLLMDSLGGSCKTVMIACVSPASCFIDETINTLKYATRASSIHNCPAVRLQPAAVNDYYQERVRSSESLGYESHMDPSGLHDVVARLQIENERLRNENISLKKQCLSYEHQQHKEPTAMVEDQGLGQFKIKPHTRVLLNGGGPTSNASSDMVIDTNSDLYSDTLSSRPVVMNPEDAERVGEQDKNNNLVCHLKATLARVSCEADCLQADKDSGECGIAAVVNENIRLLEVLNNFDILKGSLDRRTTPKRTERNTTTPDLKIANQTVRDLRIKVSQLENDIRHLTTSEAPSKKQHIIERRELRLQKETNSLLRVQLARLRVDRSQARATFDESGLVVEKEPSPPPED
eukprot:TRINITY_DN12640_c0_g1_i1.p1 TRINITY_DN12640_c0_g1~~TRINITY_DN12640_c0_g1_i1.p1  ORF type:complete len:661 (+),score=131.74 TRINITY_DN12640_c0_g1_i1:40-2022(+)